VVHRNEEATHCQDPGGDPQGGRRLDGPEALQSTIRLAYVNLERPRRGVRGAGRRDGGRERALFRRSRGRDGKNTAGAVDRAIDDQRGRETTITTSARTRTYSEDERTTWKTKGPDDRPG
jgi:hypothetical protein